MTAPPAISIALATFNGEAFLREQLESLADQTFAPFELIVQDDCSSDSTQRIVDGFADDAPFPVHFETNSGRLGSTGNFEKAIARCGGTHIALCDQDDVWRPDKIERIAQCFRRRPDLGLVFSDAERVDDELRPLGETLWQSLALPWSPAERASNSAWAGDLLQRPVVTGAAIAFASRYRFLIEPFPRGIDEWLHDRWIATLIAFVAPVEAIDDRLVLYRQHDAQQVGAPPSESRPGVDRRADNRLRMEAFARILDVLERRLDSSGLAVNKIAQSDLRDLRSHLKARLSLPKARIGRLAPIVRELGSGRYRRFSSGLGSAIKDLAR